MSINEVLLIRLSLPLLCSNQSLKDIRAPHSSLQISQRYLTFRYFKLIVLKKEYKETNLYKFFKFIIVNKIPLVIPITYYFI